MVRMLHTCKSHLDLNRIESYPHEVLSWSDLDPTCPSMPEVRAMTAKCLMGGINQAGVIEQNVDEIRRDADNAIRVNTRRELKCSTNRHSNLPGRRTRRIR